MKSVITTLAIVGTLLTIDPAAEGQTVAALDAQRRQVLRALEHAPTEAQRRLLREQLGELNFRLLLDPTWTDSKVPHTVSRGETLSRIARRYGVTVELLQMCNSGVAHRLMVGQTLWVPTGTVELVISKSANTLTIRRNGEFFHEYRVATGVNNCTPEGEFTIADRVERPTWWRPEDHRPIPFGDPEHELGTHWLAWDRKGYGIHGTNRPDTIGTQASRGCVRMRNEDVAVVYALAPIGTRVIVTD